MGLGKYFSVEVPILFCTFSMILQGAVSTNLYIFRTCYVNLGYNESDCEQLGNADNNITKWLEPKVQPTMNHINMVHSVISNLVPIMFGICVGTWSDKFGRKPFLVLSLGGMIASVFLHTLFVYLTSLSTWWFVISSLPSLLTGGVATPMIMAAAYITDVTTEEDRVFRNGIFDVIFGLSSVVANLVSSYLFYATSYLTIYLIASCLIVLSFVYSIFFIPESLRAERKQFSVKELTEAINVKDLVQSTLRKRKNNARKYFFLLVGINLLMGLAGGEMSVNTLFLRAKLHWTLSKLTIVDSITSFGKIIGTIIGISFLYRYLKIKEIPLCLFGIVLISTSDVLKGLADNDYYIYAAFAIGIFVGLPGLMLRTIISFLLPPEEMGKIMSLMSILNSPINILSSLAYPLIYNATLHTDSGLYNFVSFGIHLSAGCIVLSLIKVSFPYYKASEKEEEPILEEDDNQINGSTESLIKGSTKPSDDLWANKSLLIYVDINEARRLSEPCLNK